MPFDQLCEGATLTRLRRFSLHLMAAVRPAESHRVPDLVAACRDAGVPLTIWPMLDDRDGRWPNARNIDRFAPWVQSLVDDAQRTGLPLDEIALDLEPGLDRVARFASSGRHAIPRGAAMPVAPNAEDAFAALIERLRAQGVRTIAAVIPLVLLDRPGHAGWQRLLDTPIASLQPDRMHVMLYTSMIEGLSRRMLRRPDVRSLLYLGARETAVRWRNTAGVSLGAVDTGALGDEPTYRSVDELRDDVGLVRAAGIADIALFDLAGCLARPPAERWFEALTETPPALRVPGVTLRAALATVAGLGLSAVTG